MTNLHTYASDAFPDVLIVVTGVVGLLFAYVLYKNVSRIRVGRPDPESEGDDGDGRYILADSTPVDEAEQKCREIQESISDGANSFLYTEYQYMVYFMAVFGVIVFVLLSSASSKELRLHNNGSPYYKHHGPFSEKSIANGLFTTISFLLGGCTSILSGFLGMKIATYANARTTLMSRKSLGEGFQTAFKSGAVMGFSLTACGMLVLFVTICVFKTYFGDKYGDLFEAIAGYGLGGSSIALFGRVGGGIYTKAADVGADLVGKVEQNIPEDDPRNPGVIADNVGDNVGDIAGMGADLFGSFAESTCAALVVASLSDFGGHKFVDGIWLPRDEVKFVSMMYPLMITAVGIISSLITAQLVLFFHKVDDIKKIEPTLKYQLIISTALMTPLVLGLSYLTLPSEFDIYVSDTEKKTPKNWQVFFCVGVGLWSGMLIGILTEYYTSNRFEPTRTVADSTRTGAATNIIFGLALGYKSCIVPIMCLAVSIYISYYFAAMFGVACAALGMLGTLATGLTIDAYGPISDNAGGIAEMSGMGESVRERTDALDAAGNTTAAIGKGFAIGSAALVSLALFGAYVTRAGISNVNIIHPEEFAGLIYGAMLPYWFSALTMKSVGTAALAMVEEVRRQFKTISGLMEGTADPDYRRCVQISTEASLREMIAPGALVMLSPIAVGILFGPSTLAGMLAGSLVSGVQMAISAANTGGAWDNAKKYVEAGASEHALSLGGKGSECHKAAVIGDTVGDPLKDTSGPALNILVKLMAVESLVFAPFIKAHGGLIIN